MVEVEFEYQQKKITIQANLDDKFEDIIKLFKNKGGIENDNLCYLTNGRVISSKDIIIQDIMSQIQKKEKKMKVLVNKVDFDEENIIISEDIICPECKGLCKYEIKDYRIKLYDCKNGHINENIRLDEFLNTQKVDISKIICDVCKKASKEPYKNYFYKCYECKFNLCPNCKSNHNKSHSIINYDLKDSICNKHNETFIKYCEDCKKDICLLCVNEHNNHKTIYYEEMIVDINKIRKGINYLRNLIDKFKTNLKEIINKFSKIIEFMDIYYKINISYLDNYEKKKNRNYNLLINVNNIINSFKGEIGIIKNKYDYGYNLNHMLYTYNNMFSKNEEIQIHYKPKENKEENFKIIGNYKVYHAPKIEKIKIFNKIFINNNIYKCKIVYDNKEYDLREYFEDINRKYNNEDSFSFILKGINNITNMGLMFCECCSLLSLPGISKLDTSKVKNMCGIFSKCNLLSSLPDLSKWNTSNVENMNNLFEGCSSLISLPDISNWNTSNVRGMSSIFEGCSSLISLPDISNWNTSNVFDMSYMFEKCSSLLSLPDISKWNTTKLNKINSMFNECNLLISLSNISKWTTANVVHMNNIFTNCNSLITLPDISKLDTSKIIDMSGIFEGCSSLMSIPDISKWNTSRVVYMDNIFTNCNSLISLPDISKWNTLKVNNMNSMFEGCTLLSSIPDISIWNTSNVTNINYMFEGCNSLASLPDISKWNISNVTNLYDIFSGCFSIIKIPLKFNQ